jgi:hypothetical protein
MIDGFPSDEGMAVIPQIGRLLLVALHALCPCLSTKENILIKKEIGEYDDRYCHLILNFVSSEEPSFTPTPPNPSSSNHWYIHTHRAYKTDTTATNKFSRSP